MMRDVMQHAGQSVWPMISLIIMFITFGAILVWTYAGRKNRFEVDSRLPLEDDEQSATHTQSTRG
jgi:cbb3-type cytochrome oxidase subunit 3